MRTIIPWVGVALLAACSDAGESTPPAVEELALLAGAEEELALDAAMLDDSAELEAMIDGAAGLRWRLPKPAYKLLGLWGALVDDRCTTETAWVDKDGDGIPADTTVGFDCVEKLGTTGGLVTLTGEIAVRDSDDAVPDGGFDVRFEDFAVKTVWRDGMSQARTLNGAFRVHVQGTPPSPWRGVHLVKDFRIDLDRTLVTGLIVRAVQSTRLTAFYLPDRQSTERDPLARGMLTFAGKGTLEQGGRVWARMVETEPSLHWRRACAEADRASPGFDRGTVVFRDGWGRAVRITFRGCSHRMVTYDGTRG